MTETRIKINSILENQLPQYVRDEFPLIFEFLKQYYISIENQSGCLDILQNIDKYIKLDQLTSLVESTALISNVDYLDTTISVISTKGFPDKYGLIKINNEIITYTEKNDTQFINCVRGFSGISDYESSIQDTLIFSQTLEDIHENNSVVENLSILFLKQFFIKIKSQFAPGFENRSLINDLNQNIFVRRAKDFYSSKGTDESFTILFKVLYGENVEVIKPRDFLIQPSDATYQKEKQLIVESISGDPIKLINKTLYQDQNDICKKAYGSISNVEIVYRGGKNYYKISLDYDYNKDINVTGSTFGEFTIHPKTMLITSAVIGDTSLDVDSTVGFPNSGNLLITFQDGTFLNVNYTSKSLTQFLECSGIDREIPSGINIATDSFAYGYSGVTTDSEIVKVRVTGVISGILDISPTFYFNTFDTIEIESLGKNCLTYKENNWLFNISTTYQVKNIEIIDYINNKYVIETYVDHNFILGDVISLKCSDGSTYSSSVISIQNKSKITIKIQENLNLNLKYVVKKLLSKARFNNQPELNSITTNIQNVYVDSLYSVYVASPSLPSYQNSLEKKDRSIIFSASSDGENLTLKDQNGSQIEHFMYTGDAVYYKPESITNSLNIQQGNYFVKKVDDYTIKLSYSLSNIDTNNYISLSGNVTNSKFEIPNFANKNLKSQKLIRKISSPVDIEEKIKTLPGKIGILINGVEILNYKSKDYVYYGDLQDIIVTSPGSDYDVINPPALTILGGGTGAMGFAEVVGNLKEINIIDGGFDYVEDPIITISGGNGSGARAKAELQYFDYFSSFNSESQSNHINLANNTIGFSSHHKFRDGEKVVYKTYRQTAVGGLSTDSTYYVSVQDIFTVKVHKTYLDSIVGINTIDISSYGVGNHDFKSYERKRKVSNIKVVSSGQGYKNRKIQVLPVGISTYQNSIFAKKHGYSSGEILLYNCYGTTISGLSTGQYYVTKIDDDNFKLSPIGTGNTVSDFYYSNKIYSQLNSSGIGTHEFNYPPISVSISGRIGVSTLAGENYNAIIQPIFRGEIKSVFLFSGGVGYGSSEILNYNKQPSVVLNSGSSAQISPIISNGRIQEILIQSTGYDYNSPPKIFLSSTSTSGISTGFNLTPVISNGKLIEVKVINGGTNFNVGKVSANVISAGSGAKFECIIRNWNVNLVERIINQVGKIGEDDGIITEGIDELQYCHLYSPRKLRQLVFGSKFVSGSLSYVPDLQLYEEKEINSDSHSPIIGWAYDGNPIYGPYGYSSVSGGTIRALRSGYKLSDSLQNRPNFPDGFFIEDYVFVGDGDLDEYNGRFCITPEFPNGIYAYFSTINQSSIESSGIFQNYRKPIFPYFIGNFYKSFPISANFDHRSNQEIVDLQKTKLLRNITPYGLNNEYVDYEFITDPNKIQKQTNHVKNISSSEIGYVKIVSGGENYKVNDKIVFDNEGSGGSGASARVSHIKGKSVKSISAEVLEINDVEFENNAKNFVGFAKTPHNLSNNDTITISGLSTTNPYLNSQFVVGIQSNIYILSHNVSSQVITGIVTYFKVSGNLSYSNIRENDIYQIESEKIKIVSSDKKSSTIKVIRGYDGTIGSAHTAFVPIIELSRKFNINIDLKSSNTSIKSNVQLYFDPEESLGLGTLPNQKYTVNFKNPGAGISSLSIPTKTIYLPDHNLKTGDQLVYNSNGGSQISISTNGIVASTLTNNTTLYAARISENLIGLSFDKVGLGSTGFFVGINSSNVSNTLYFSGIGTGTIHSLTTNFENKISGKVSKNKITVVTKSDHELSLGDTVLTKCISGITTSYKIVYNDECRRLLINPTSFLSAAVNTSLNTITINEHGYSTGQAVIYSSTSPSIGIVNNKIYFIIAIDNNKFQLAENYYNSTLEYAKEINIETSSFGTISLINPRIEVVSNQTVIFDLSDTSLSYTSNSNLYSAFDFNLYLDKSYKNIFESTSLDSNFEVFKFGKIGIDSNSRLVFRTSDFVPRVLYYNLSPLQSKDVPEIKKQIISDNQNVINNNQLNMILSEYTQSGVISGIGSTTFTYTSVEKPEKYSYLDSEANITYDTTSTSVKGEIGKIDIVSFGRKYKKLPSVSSISSLEGKNAILRPYGKNVGSIENIQIDDIGFEYSTDITIRPTLKIPQIFRVDPLFTFDEIGITSTGKKYIFPPDLIVLDGYTDNIISDVLLEYELGDTKVKIAKNTRSLTNTIPRIVPINNSNGVRINSISYNNYTKNVTLQLITNYSNILDFPFNIGDEILVENVSIGINSTGRGYNSSEYNYKYFKLNAVIPNIGGSNASITYNLGEYLGIDQFPGTFDALLSAGTVVRKADQPIFDVHLKANQFLVGEDVVLEDGSKIGTVVSWDYKNQFLKVLSTYIFKYNQKLIGQSSNAKSTIIEIYRFNSTFNIAASSIVDVGWKNDKGFLNNSNYRIHDSDYYQYLSYSLKSKISYEKWNSAVSTLNHTAGFKKFSDLIIESKSDEFVGIATIQNLGYFTSTADLVSYIDLNSVVDFDLAYEKTINISDRVISDEIVFNSTIIQDYFESIGNRVLLIDNISNQFSSNPRTTEYSIVDTFLSEEYRVKKYVTLVKDSYYTDEKQCSIVTILNDGIDGYINQYAKNNTLLDLGSFDYRMFGSEGNLLFYPNKLYINNYNISILSLDIQNNIVGVGTTNLGNIVRIDSTNSNIPAGTSAPITLVGIASTYRSSKILIEIHFINDTYCQYNELNIIHNGTDVQILEYGNLNNSATNLSGLGTFNAYFSGSNILVDLTPNTSIGTSCIVNSVKISIASTLSTGIGTHVFNSGLIDSGIVSISSSISPVKTKISGYSSPYESAYYIVSIEDTVNNMHQMNEIVVTNDQSDAFIVNFGEIYTNSGLGTFGVDISGNNVDLMFTANPNIDVQIRTYKNSLNLVSQYDQSKVKLDMNNFIYRSSSGIYKGSLIDVKRSFNLTHKQNDIFVRNIDSSNSNIVDINQNIIKIPNHFFVTGEKLTYSYLIGNSPIGIETANISGIGTTTILPPNVYAIKIDDSHIKIAGSVTDALSDVKNPLILNSLGVGTEHYLKSNNPNEKSLILIDNVVQSPIVSTSVTTITTNYLNLISNIIEVVGVTSFFGGDLIKIDNEIMKINAVGIPSATSISVERPWMGSGIQTHAAGSVVKKILGNYNIVDNTLHFYTSPIGEVPFGTTTNSPSEVDYLGITTRSSFGGRVFLKSGFPNSSDETYSKNYIFDNISEGFNGITTQFSLKVNGNNISGISSANPLILINEIVQQPQRQTSPVYIGGNYRLSESVGVTSIQFTGTTNFVSSDIKSSNVPVGGVILSVASTNGFGYQPLISAGGTSIVSIAGTISSISIGNSGSGYRAQQKYEIETETNYIVGIGQTQIYLQNYNSIFQILNLLNSGSNCTIGVGTFISQANIVSVASTFIVIGTANTTQYIIPPTTSAIINVSNPTIGIVKVGVANSSVGIITTTHIGFATLISGNISTSINITNSGYGYTSSNPPQVVIDPPLSYSDIPLIYSNSSAIGMGSGAKVNVVVGQGSSVVNFEIINHGYSYRAAEKLTIPVGGTVGIPTISSAVFQEFQLSIDKTQTDKFLGMVFGDFEVFDPLDDLFNGIKVSFPIKSNGIQRTIRAKRGSLIEIKATILVFINDILQEPDLAYTFNGGSIITFSEPPKQGDTSKILFYKGTSDLDVVDIDILETIKVGDVVKLQSDDIGLTQGKRSVIDINSSDSIKTLAYSGFGISQDEKLLRPIVWTKQTEDIFIDGKDITKDRQIYRSNIYPYSRIIQNVGIGSTIIFVDNLRTFFENSRENASIQYNSKLKLISEDNLVAAAATSLVSIAGSVSNIILSNGGGNYTQSPEVIVQNPIGLGTTQRAIASSSISNGIVTSISISYGGIGYTNTNPPSVLIAPPKPVVEIFNCSSYSGDFGIISGISTSSIGIASTAIVFDFFIPQNSFLRKQSVVGTAITISGIQTNYYFVVYNSNVGKGVTSLRSDGSIVSVGNTFIDNVYQVESVSIAQTSVAGVGLTYVKRVVTSVSNYNQLSGIGYSGFFGEFSWGRIFAPARPNPKEFIVKNNGLIGISTSPILQRENPLRSVGYNTSII